jgi:tetratricopeptide (TPR) repeat protein
VFKLPEDHSVRCKLATSFLMAGMVPEAVNALSYILDRDPGNEEARSLADSREILAHLVKEAKGALRSRDYDAALVSIDKAILFVPEYHESYFLRAIVRYQKGKREECMRDLEKTLELEPRHEQAKNLLEELGKKQSSGMFG